ncbi:MAG TPA: twin-arginine translocase TatA/TatE family subunit [Candidatus Limnocylindrales bacterium]|nr:twin-arginine translocase TatA/TatE family subunit [Candidatus Limnocylindrales bacterium]
MPFNIGAPELIIILIIALVVIGPGRLPDVGAALGKSIREFRKASSDLSESTKIDTSPLPPSTNPNVNPAETPIPSPTAAPAPTPVPPSVTPTASTVPAPVAMPQAPGDDETDPTP